MKQVKFLLLAAFVAMFTGCQNEERAVLFPELPYITLQ